jgi:RNA polymerase sigma factor (sigma-70 family)
MRTSPINRVIDHLRRAVLLPDGAGLGDGELLSSFIERHDETDLAALVGRHGPMVWGVCRRLLSHHDAEDAFQATFLVLVRKAASIRSREMVGNWLYGVAHQTALLARRTAARRRAREVQVTGMPDIEAVQQDQWPDLRPLLDEELSRLPEIYRAVIVLCELEGRSRKETACQLGVPEGTVAGRLARARVMLAKRLIQRGVTLSGGALAAILSQNVASAGVPASVVSKTIKVASLTAAGQAAATGAIPVKVAALTEGVMKAMLFTKLKTAIAVVLMLGFVATGATILTCHTAAGQDDKKPTAEKPVEPAAKQEKEKEGFTAWGKEVGVLQAGLGFRPGEKRAYGHGETVTLVVRVRNVGKKEVEFQYLKEFFKENPPIVTDADGKKLPGYKILFTPLEQVPEEVSLAPGKEIELSSEQYQLMPTNERGKGHSGRFLALWVGTGKVSVQYNRLFGNTSVGRIKVDPDLLDLTTGSLELEIKPAPPPATEKK